MNKNERLASILRAERENKSWSQEQFAEKLGLPLSRVESWENALSEPSFSELLKISELFGVSAEELVKRVSETEETNTTESAADRAAREAEEAAAKAARLKKLHGETEEAKALLSRVEEVLRGGDGGSPLKARIAKQIEEVAAALREGLDQGLRRAEAEEESGTAVEKMELDYAAGKVSVRLHGARDEAVYNSAAGSEKVERIMNDTAEQLGRFAEEVKKKSGEGYQRIKERLQGEDVEAFKENAKEFGLGALRAGGKTLRSVWNTLKEGSRELSRDLKEGASEVRDEIKKDESKAAEVKAEVGGQKAQIKVEWSGKNDPPSEK